VLAAPRLPDVPIVPDVPAVPEDPQGPANDTVHEVNVPEPTDCNGVITNTPVLGLYETTLPII